MEMSCNFDQILYATCTMDCNKKHSERKFEIGLFNSASHAVVACTAPEIGALKDRPNYSRASIGK